MLKDGWEPVPAARRAADAQANDDRTASREAQPGESAARRRFRNVKERHDADSAAGLNENEDPFEDSRTTTPSPRDIAHAESPFHTEN